MENLLQEVIQADQNAQQRVTAVQNERANVRRIVEGQKKAIEERYQKETQERLAAHKQKLQEEIELVQKEKDQEYEAALKQLHTTFEERKKDWVTSIVKRCLEA